MTTSDLHWAEEKFSGAELDLVRRAYEQANEAHDGQLRVSGEPYVLHCVEVARMLTELRLDHHAVAAGLLHD
ncbi:MAG: HD domain-containing protein, partial [Anaerolineae bacterium]